MSGTEDMKDITAYCPHKDTVNGYCKKCSLYLCQKCQLQDHYEHLQDIVGLDSLFTEAINEYTTMSNALDKHILTGSQTVKDSAIDETLLQVEKRIAEEYDKLIKDIKDIEEEQAATIRSTPFLFKLQEEKDALQGEDLKKLAAFDKKLGTTISQLLGALSEEKYDGVDHLLTEAVKEEFTKEAKGFEPYYAKQREFLKHLEIMKAVKPKLTYNSQTIEDLVQIKGVHEEIIKLFFWDSKSHSVYIHFPKSKTIMKSNINNVSIPKKHAQIVVEDQILILCGGKKKPSIYYSNMYVFSEEEKKMIEKANMNCERAYHGIAGLKDLEVYVAGGENKTGLLNSVEAYDLKANKWTVLPPLIQKRKSPTLCVCAEKYLYVIGGATESIEVLNLTERKEWEEKQVKGMINIEKAGAIGKTPNEILVFGGKSGGKKLDSCFVYDIFNKQLNPVSPLALPACFNKSDSREAEGFVYSTGNKKATTHVYDINSNKWSIIPEKDYKFKYTWDY